MHSCCTPVASVIHASCLFDAGVEQCATGGAALFFAAHLLQALIAGAGHGDLSAAYLRLLELLADSGDGAACSLGEPELKPQR